MTFGNASKGTLKKAVKLAAATLGHVLPRHEAASRILTYHSVGTRDHDMNVSPEAFEQQMAWLAENQLARPLSDAVEGKPGVAVTFDDGYRDNLIEAARATIVSAAARHECRGAHTVKDYERGQDDPEFPLGRNDRDWLKHTLWYSDGDRLDYKPVRMKPLTTETVPPKVRTF